MANWKENGKLKLLIIVGTRPEIIRLAAVIKKCRKYFDTILAHTGQNYDYTLNGIFFHDLELDDPEVYMDAVGADLGETMGNIIAKSYQLMVELQPDAVLTAPETRSSSPVRILRDPETLEALTVRGLYPCGEGAGYAGGIVSAAVDGIRCAERVMQEKQ